MGGKRERLGSEGGVAWRKGSFSCNGEMGGGTLHKGQLAPDPHLGVLDLQETSVSGVDR